MENNEQNNGKPEKDKINSELQIDQNGETFFESITAGAGEMLDVGREIVTDWSTEAKGLASDLGETTERINKKDPYVKGIPNALVFWGGLGLIGFGIYSIIK